MSSILQPLVDLFFSVLNFIHQTFGLNWGWSIVVLTIIVRIVLIPLTWKQFKSMRAMQALQPQIKALQEKYKGDRQVLNQKMMEFYSENKINPFGSCLPLLLQMPVFFALFYMLRQESGVGGHFATDNVWLWIRTWGFDQPWWWAETIIQFDLILLIIYVVSQFGASLQMTSRDPTQRIMMLSMPLVIGVIMYVGKWPAGLFIYWVTSNLWTVAQQFIIMRVVPAPQPVSSGGTNSGATKQPKSRERKKPKAKTGKG
jgi:YidC/Oxa1 family membrane protein insertase